MVAGRVGTGTGGGETCQAKCRETWASRGAPAGVPGVGGGGGRRRVLGVGQRHLQGRCLQGLGTARLSADKRQMWLGLGVPRGRGRQRGLRESGAPEERPQGRGEGHVRGPEAGRRCVEAVHPGEKRGLSEALMFWNYRTRLPTSRRLGEGAGAQ